MNQQGIWGRVNVMGVERKASLITLGMAIVTSALLVIILAFQGAQMFNGLFFVVITATATFSFCLLLNYLFKRKSKVPTVKAETDTNSLKGYNFKYHNIKED